MIDVHHPSYHNKLQLNLLVLTWETWFSELNGNLSLIQDKALENWEWRGFKNTLKLTWMHLVDSFTEGENKHITGNKSKKKHL